MRLIRITILTVLVFGAVAAAAAAPETKTRYVDAATLTVVNKAQEGGPQWQRIDVARYPELSAGVERYYRQSSGLAVVFRTDSRNIRARWRTASVVPQSNVMLIATRGLDLYIRKDGKWAFAGVGTPQKQDVAHKSALVENMEEGWKECMLYLPLYDEVTALEIGIDEGAAIESAANPFERKLVIVGSSITHCASVSRPGMAYPAQLGRSLGMETANLGACGLCKLEGFYAKIVAETKADAFVFDAFSNPSARQIEERLEEFVRTVRAAHPATPLVFLQTEVRETTLFDTKKRAYEQAKRDAAAKIMKRLCAEDKNLHFIEEGMYIGDDHEGTSDGVHPTDLGLGRMLERLKPQLQKIFSRHGILPNAKRQ